MTQEMWIFIGYWDYEPSTVYGPFDSEEAAFQYATMHGDEWDGWEVKGVQPIPVTADDRQMSFQLEYR